MKLKTLLEACEGDLLVTVYANDTVMCSGMAKVIIKDFPELHHKRVKPNTLTCETIAFNELRVEIVSRETFKGGKRNESN